jgi:thymidylate synthase (FAD)
MYNILQYTGDRMSEINDINEDLRKISLSNNLVELVSCTPSAEQVMLYCARVSNPKNQLNFNNASLLKYCIANKHWSVFEQAHLVLQVKTSRAISAQILRHKSFSFQEFSQRYAALDESGVVIYAARRQDDKNRQNSIDDLSEEVKVEWEQRQLDNWKRAFEHYTWALNNNIAKECARFVLPMQSATTVYISGTVRSFIHYLDLRASNGTQQEHMDIAIEGKKIFKEALPTVAAALGW